jgi:hypothetical protein
MTSHNRKCLSEKYHQVGQHRNFLGQYHHILQNEPIIIKLNPKYKKFLIVIQEQIRMSSLFFSPDCRN